ncbi:MAG: choice-of-anchor J domain-containing protein, partial [Candidatus Cloacimonetes bacterium]|nr:choice-of-anchor J domain-containing protein [Candidatus Cloacimonadota bacterium]
MRKIMLLFYVVFLLTGVLFSQHIAYVGFLDSEGNSPDENDVYWEAVRVNTHPDDIIGTYNSLNSYFLTPEESGFGFIILAVQCEDFQNPWMVGEVVTVTIVEISSGDCGIVNITLTDTVADFWNIGVNPVTLNLDPSTIIPSPVPCVFPLDNAFSIPPSVQLEWRSHPFAQGYKLYIGSDNPPTNILAMLDLGNTLTYSIDQLQENELYYWQVIPYNMLGDAINCPVWSFVTRDVPTSPAELWCDITYQGVNLLWEEPADIQDLSYNIYRDDVQINQEPVEIPFYLDSADGLIEDQIYEYKVTAFITEPTFLESVPCDSVLVTYFVIDAPPLAEDFESYNDFVTEFGDWTLIDGDGENTIGFGDLADFPGENEPHSFMVFNPNSTTPPLQNADAFSGTKYAAAFCSETGAGDNWLISHPIHLGPDTGEWMDDHYIQFMVRSYSTQYGMETLELCISNGSTDPADFTVISGDMPIEVPPAWTPFIWDLSDYCDQIIRIAIHHTSPQGVMLMLDSIMMIGTTASENNNNSEIINNPVLIGNFPNPFNPETTISFNLKENVHATLNIFNIRGQHIATLADDNFTAGSHNIVWKGTDSNGNSVTSGIYFYKLQAGT